ncbi:MAG: hypothetical protein JWM80_976 [Cyanobacteria bacterium RYN_339]|nr:hypothetical protein [Cyanobacteria bacterium RYN_339]
MFDEANVGAAAMEQRNALNQLCARRLQGRNLIIASNRGPVEFYEEAGKPAYRRGQGGLVTAMSSFVEVTQTTWIAAAMTEVDARLAKQQAGRMEVEVNGHLLAVSFVTPTPTQYQRFYDEVSNSVLWFLQHSITNPPTHPTFDQAMWEAWEHGYVAVNRLFADAIATAAHQGGKPPVFMIHDYHLYLVPGMLRQRFPDAPIQHFTHIAWPSPDAWRQLPHAIREAILANMLGSDVVGFHCQRYAVNFLRTCEELLGADVDWDNHTVRVGERCVRVRDYPISIDPGQLLELAATPAVHELEATFMAHRPPRLILQVARTDPSKNILRSFHAYEHFLSLYPQYLGEVQFLGLLPASRQTTELYKEYFDELCQVARRINEDYARPGWKPIELFFENDYHRAIAAMKQYDLLVVNSIADGMNLVAKEGPIVNERAGVLLLSEGAGAVDELGDAAIVVNPFDLVGMAHAFHEALDMPLAERQRALASQRATIGGNTIFRWAHDQIADLVEAAPRPGTISIFPAVEGRREVTG